MTIVHFVMKLCRFQDSDNQVHIGLARADNSVASLTPAGIVELTPLLEQDDMVQTLREIVVEKLPTYSLSEVKVLAPIEQQEVWAAGVTYLRSKTARMEESDFSASAYDRVYEAPRPELFFKSLPDKVAPTGTPVGIRKDARWNVPEPELALVINSRQQIVGYTVGNDMSSRDIEGENVLYLPQAKIYSRSCALGPFIRVGVDEAEARSWTISLEISRSGQSIHSGQTQVSQIKRSFDELAGFLFRSQVFTQGAILLTGTGIVPPDTFTLEEGDQVSIRVSGVGELINSVIRV